MCSTALQLLSPLFAVVDMLIVVPMLKLPPLRLADAVAVTTG